MVNWFPLGSPGPCPRWRARWRRSATSTSRSTCARWRRTRSCCKRSRSSRRSSRRPPSTRFRPSSADTRRRRWNANVVSPSFCRCVNGSMGHWVTVWMHHSYITSVLWGIISFLRQFIFASSTFYFSFTSLCLWKAVAQIFFKFLNFCTFWHFWN